ncbi:MAG: hypothetical protein JWO37_845 [Acidimicrobiales bacterium]|nr:hypothetical protein [Acidimicrobiales bacterium]
MAITTLEQLQDHDEALAAGTRVEVRRRFDDAWSHGFEVADVTASGYRIRRLSDRMILPVEFVFDDVRKERRRQGMWWY